MEAAAQGAYQAERALADLDPGLPVGCSHPHAILHDGIHGTLLLLPHVPLLSGSWVCTAGKHQSACSLWTKGSGTKTFSSEAALHTMS